MDKDRRVTREMGWNLAGLMHTRPALYQGSYSPVPYRYFKVRLLACYPIFPRPPSPLCCTGLASITAIVKECDGISYRISWLLFSYISAWFCLDGEQGQLHVPEGGARTRAREKAHKRAWPAPELCACFLHGDLCLVRCSLPGGERQVTSTIQPGLVSS